MADSPDDQQETTLGDQLPASSRKQLRQKQQGLRLQEAMLLRGISEQEVASHCNKSADTVRRWLSGSSSCTAWEELAALLEVSAGWLAYGEEKEDWTVVPNDPDQQSRRRALALLEEVKGQGEEIRIELGSGVVIQYRKPSGGSDD